MRELVILASELAVGAMSVDVVLDLGIPVAGFSRLVVDVVALGFVPIDVTRLSLATTAIFLPKDEKPTRDLPLLWD